jgi:hypothetical protein
MLSRSSCARVTSDQHQSGHGSTTGRVRRRAGNVSEYRFGDTSTGAFRRRRGTGNAAVVDVHAPGAGGLGYRAASQSDSGPVAMSTNLGSTRAPAATSRCATPTQSPSFTEKLSSGWDGL